ncbi:PAS domain-containing protein [Pelomonas sp. V22]|uniref:PAS domain-containing sensor histidine kinase n=1 Tax=Pelomonas sp. V22 TaxID=2822139 RepID=UPI0024A7C15E|nr:ATP-binding protein [Pelomonas sp. V22]MDI4635425.1 PAS domain-containing protein [Pelomonas sp. V22]
MARVLQALLPRSLVGRVFALYSTTLLVFVASALVLFYRYQFQVELTEAQERADTLNSVILPVISDSAVIGDYDTIQRTLERAVQHSSFSSASFIDLRGGVVKVPNPGTPSMPPPTWLQDRVAALLLDSNLPVVVGGSDYGVLRLSFASDRIAGKLWQQTLVTLAMGLVGLVAGLGLIRLLLVRWLGRLNQVQDFERALISGDPTQALLSADDAPTEFRATFEVLGRTAASLQLQRAQAAVTLRAIADSVFTLDADGRIVLANPAAQQTIGLPLSHLTGRLMQDVMPQAFDAGRALRPWSGRRLPMADALGEIRVVDSSLSLINDDQGQAVGHVMAFRDITEQHLLEQRLREELGSRERALVALRQVLEGLTQVSATAEASDREGAGDDLSAISQMIGGLVGQLQARGAQLNAIFELTPDAFVSFDAQRRVSYASPAFARLTGIASDPLGLDEDALEALLRRQADGAITWLGFAAMQRDGNDEDRQVVIEIKRPTHRVLELRLRGGRSEAISQVLALRDVSHAFEVDRMKSEFLSMAAHELRTPMASIYGFVEILQHRQMDEARRHEVLEIIHRQSTLMIAVINELLDLARIEARGGQDFVLESLDLCTVVPALVHDFNPPPSREAPVLQCQAERCMVRVDRNKLQQALGNVLSNAYKYSPGGGTVSLQLRLELYNGQPMAGIEVADQGIGMSPDQLARVSERFYRADDSGAIPGTGLGMSIVKEIVELHGGRLALQSQPGQGTTVTLWLPTADTMAPDT